MSKLWEKGVGLHPFIEKFTVGNDREVDLYIAKWDVIGSIAHVKMLERVNLINGFECETLLCELGYILNLIEHNNFNIEEGIEDVHSQVELMLTKRIGSTGKKIHAGRSRNDQVLLDVRLYMRNELECIVNAMEILFKSLIMQSEKYKSVEMPGYTHLQIAMPSSFGLWFGSLAESLADDLVLLKSAFDLVNRNPLGSAAGYGSSFPLNRDLTTQLLGFDDLNYNVMYAQWSKLKVETAVMNALNAVGKTISRFANDACLYMSGNFGFIALPDNYTTGSSIMPQKKNPDAFEVLRAKSNEVSIHLFRLLNNTNNLSSGYFRDYQCLKKPLFESFDLIKECLEVSDVLLNQLIINRNIMDDPRYKYIYSVDEIDKEVRNGVPFREAYKKIALKIQQNTFEKSEDVLHTLKGSKDNLCNAAIEAYFYKNVKGFPFTKIKFSMSQLLDFTTE